MQFIKSICSSQPPDVDPNLKNSRHLQDAKHDQDMQPMTSQSTSKPQHPNFEAMSKLEATSTPNGKAEINALLDYDPGEPTQLNSSDF